MQTIMNRTKKMKKNNKKIINKKITIVIILVVCLIISIFAICSYIKNNRKNINSPSVTLRNVNGKLLEYIKGLGDEYYIRYNGNFGKKGLNEETVLATVEYTQDKNNTAIYSENLKMNVVTDNKYSYNIIKQYNMILKGKLPIRFNVEEYNLISDFGQKYVADVSENVLGVDYIYQEYDWKESKIRYYFVGDELRYIRIIVGDSDRKINIRVDRNVRKDMFEIPNNYTIQDV